MSQNVLDVNKYYTSFKMTIIKIRKKSIYDRGHCRPPIIRYMVSLKPYIVSNPFILFF